MKPRNYIMANVAKNDPTRYHTRSVDPEHIKLQKNRARRRAAERKEICEGSSMVEHLVIGKIVSNQLRCGRSSMVEHKVVALGTSVRI